MCLNAFSCVPNFKAIGLRVQILWQFFASVQKKEKKLKEKTKLVCLYFRNSWGEFGV